MNSQLVDRLDVAPVLSDYIKSRASEESDHFCFNKTLSKQYRSKDLAAKEGVLDAAYLKEMNELMVGHYEFCELYMKYQKGTRTERNCQLCTIFCYNYWVVQDQSLISGTTYQCTAKWASVKIR